jgi:hypothetical protein
VNETERCGLVCISKLGRSEHVEHWWRRMHVSKAGLRGASSVQQEYAEAGTV